MSRSLFSLCLLVVCATGALAQDLFDKAPRELVGDWSCGADRIYITKLGSIEILGDGYVAGLFDAADGVMDVQWEDGARSSLTYAAVPGQSLTLGEAGGKEWTCVPRG